MRDNVILLNGNYMPYDTISWRKAVNLLMRGVVEPFGDQYLSINSANGKQPFLIPRILRLIKTIRSIYKRSLRYCKRNVFTRDRYSCMYCGKNVKGHPTIDHVIPRSRGGKDEFENVVTSCAECNTHKRNRIPREAGMTLIKSPTHPTIGEFFRIKLEQDGSLKILEDLYQNQH